MERRSIAARLILDLPLRNPITGTAGCCARTASGPSIAALPRSVMNPPRLTHTPKSTKASTEYHMPFGISAA